MNNLETVLQCLNDFEGAKEKNIGPELDELLSHIAKTGRTEFPWHLLKPLIAYKLEKVLDDFFENNLTSNAFISEPTSKSKDLYPDAKKLISSLNHFTGTPFTIQRLCELITEPKKHYKTTDKFLRGVEKNIMVVSTVQPDGSLITRLPPTSLTNGDISPTKTDPAPTSPNLAPPVNSPLNSITQDNNTNTSAVPEVPSLEEKKELESNEENSADTETSNTSVNITPEDTKQELSNVIDNKHDIDTTEKESTEKCSENTTNESTGDEIEKTEVLANNATLTDEKTTTGEEKMDES